jgi:hypothetical protein
MTRSAYLIASVAAFCGVVFLHVISYWQSIPDWELALAACASLLLCIPLVRLFVRTKKVGPTANVWVLFWSIALIRCPRWIAASLTLSVFVMWITGALSTFWHLSLATFRTACILIPASAALSHAVSLWRLDEQMPNQSSDPAFASGTSRAGHEPRHR